MLKAALNMIAGAMICALVSAAYAVVGNVPVNGYQTPDGTWLLGLAGGQNNSYQFGITAAGTTQATATQLAAGVRLLQVDTAAASSGVALPQCVAGNEVSLYNNGANTLTVYPSIANNLLTAAQDTINSSTSFSVATHVAMLAFCAKNGVWAAK